MKPAKKKPAGSIVRLEATEGWKVTRKPAPAKAAASARRRSATGEAAEPVVPDFLPKNAYEVLDVVEVEPVGGARRSAAGSEVKLRATVPPDTSVLLLIRQESGAIAFRRPSEVARRGAAAGKAAAVEVEFDVPVLAGDPQDRRRGLVSFVTAALVKIVKKAVDVVVDKAAELVVPFLARKLEERLWHGRHQGWLHVTQATLAAKKLVPKVPDFGEGERALLFIHGTFSDAGSAFTDLATTPFFEALREVYGDNIFAFDHFTFSKTLEENAQDMLAALPHRTYQFDVITHSRGGLVLRAIAEAANSAPANTARLRFGQVVLVASPNGGTPLVTPQHWDDKLSWMANILEMFPDNPFTTAGEWLAGALSWFADKVVGNAPGLMTMDMQGEVIANLQQGGGAPSRATYYALAANFHAPQKWWSRLADMGVDNFFGGANDLVVPTEGGWQVDIDPAFWVPAERVGCFGLQGNIAPQEPSAVNHINFFARPETADFILRALAGEPLELPLMATRQGLATRRGARAAMAAGLPLISSTTTATAEAPVLAEAAAKTAPPSESLFKTKGFGDEGVLTLTVISHDLHTSMEEDNTVPMLLAMYAGTHVAVPFKTRGGEAGQRWYQAIKMQRFLLSYVWGEGKTFELELDQGKTQEIDHPTEAFLQKFGELLFNALFPDEVRRLYDVARFRHDKRKLNIIFTSMIPWVADFPWEFAFDRSSETFVSTADVRFVRNVLTSMPENRIADYPGKLRMLVVSALPLGSEPVSIEKEEEGIRNSFRRLTDAGLLEVDVIARATPETLHQHLRERLKGKDFDILHFIGHGEYHDKTKTGYLRFEDENRNPVLLSASSFLDILRNRGIRIVFLNACETGRGADAYYNRGVAMALVHDGIPAVVANQYSVLDRMATLFSVHFYECLAFGMALGDAVREARIAIRYSAEEPMDWGVPVLFARNPNASLYDNELFSPPGATSMPGMRHTGVLSSDTERRRARQRRQEQAARRLKVSVWDVANTLPYREDFEPTLEEMNRAQDQFFFRLERMTAPRGLWKVDTNKSAYLQAESVVPKMERIRKKLGVDYLFCITDLPLRDSDTESLYLWSEDEPVDGVVPKVVIMSIWGFEPPLTGRILKAAFANCMAGSLADDLSGVVVSDDEPRGSVGYFNAERDVRHLAGGQKFTKDNLKRMRKKKLITEAQIKALESLLDLFQPSGVESLYPEQTAPGAKKKTKVKTKVTSKTKTKVTGKTATPVAKLKKKK